MKTNPGKIKAVIFTRAQVKGLLNYFFRYQRISEASSSTYLGIILCNDLSLADQFNYTVQEAWKAPHFIIRVLRKGNSNTKRLVFTSLVRPILEYRASCCHPYKEGQINALELVQKKAAKFANHTIGSVWETLTYRSKISRICAFFEAYTGERAWKAKEDRLQRQFYLSSDDHSSKIRTRKQGKNIGKYSFVNGTFKLLKQLPVEALVTLPVNTYF